VSAAVDPLAKGYNERLFSGRGFRNYYHMARYNWLRAQMAKRTGPFRVVELGCFDGKALDHMPPVERYVGLDANWEGGLDLGRVALAGRPEVTLIETLDPESLAQFPDKSFNVAVAMETMEHIPEPARGRYLHQLARIVDGVILITVPNEKGPVFLAKHLVKRAKYGLDEPYSWGEVANATLGRLDKVERIETGHKGFDYARLADELRRHFIVERVEGVPTTGLPASLSMTVGIVARTR